MRWLGNSHGNTGEIGNAVAISTYTGALERDRYICLYNLSRFNVSQIYNLLRSDNN